MKFWDASAILPLCLREPRSAVLTRLATRDGAIVAWWATEVECCSGLARLRREGLLDADDEEQARRLVERLAGLWTEVEPSRQVRERALRALLLHPLRAADAFQLAAALVWASGQPAGHEFVCLDARLRTAAKQEGLVVLPAA